VPVMLRTANQQRGRDPFRDIRSDPWS